VRANDVKEVNVVLVGAAAANPWVELFEPNMEFCIFRSSYSSVYRAQSGAGRKRAFKMGFKLRRCTTRVYGVVAFPPNLSGKGNVLILERTSMAGTECAWEFVADDSALLLFLLRIKRTDGTIPHFQLVLGSNNMNGSSGKSSILTWRVMN
jgi:hypothetical protein